MIEQSSSAAEHDPDASGRHPAGSPTVAGGTGEPAPAWNPEQGPVGGADRAAPAGGDAARGGDAGLAVLGIDVLGVADLDGDRAGWPGPDGEPGSDRPGWPGPGGQGALRGPDAHTGEADRRRPAGGRRVRLVTVGVLALAAITVLALVGPTTWQVLSERGTTLSQPDRVAGLTRNTGTEAAQAAEYLKEAMLAEVDVKDPVAAVYTDQAGRSVFFFGGTASTWSPGRQLDAVFAGVTDRDGGVAQLAGYDPGPLGGVLRCGTTPTGDDGQRMTVCGWSDHGSVAVALFADRSPADAAVLLRDMRAHIQHRA